jgi:hypothetical protein
MIKLLNYGDLIIVMLIKLLSVTGQPLTVGSSQICVIIFAYVRLNAYWSGLLGLF